jgi:GAF domain-containing protein
MAIFHQDAFFWRLINLTRSLSTETDKWKLFGNIMDECQHITHCDGATLYLLDEDEAGARLDYTLIQNKSLGLIQKFCEPGQSALTPIRIQATDSDTNQTHSIAAYCALQGQSVCVEDVYNAAQFNISGIKAFDDLFDYRTRSVLSVPIIKPNGRVLGVIQLINPQNPLSGTVAHYCESQIAIIEALSALLATILESAELEQAEGELLVRLSQPQGTNAIFERVLNEAMRVSRADGGTIYWYRDDAPTRLEFVALKNTSLNLEFTALQDSAHDIAPLLLEENGEPNLQNVATFTAISKQVVNIDDAYNNTTFDFSGMKNFDQQYGYHSQSFLSVPLLNHAQEVIGVMQLINARNSINQDIIPFAEKLEPVVKGLASYAAMTLENDMLIHSPPTQNINTAKQAGLK